MKVMSLALGGCIKGPPVAFGLTEDTGGHITYALGAAMALAERADVSRVELVTRLIDDAALGPAYAVPLETISPKFAIRRIDTGNRAYLTKEANAADRPAFVRALLAYLAIPDNRPDIIHAHFADAAEVAIAVREAFGIPFIYTAHSLGIDKAAAGTNGLAPRIDMEARAIAGADAIIASSRDETERQLMQYDGACPARIHLIAPGATLGDELATGTEPGAKLLAPFLREPGKPLLLAIARPVRKKNLSGLVDLYARDPALRAKANLAIVAGLRDGPGSGEPEQRGVIRDLLDKMDEHGLYGQLALPKRHDRSEVSSLFALARSTRGLFINPAFTEPYGLTLTEAAAHGVPVVATDKGGPGDIVAALGHGLVADPNDPVAFGAAIHALLNDPARWRTAARNGATRAKALGWPAYADAFVTVAAGLLAPKALPRVKIAPTDFLLCDIDNTLTGCRTGSAQLREMLSRRSALGFGVATGRSLHEAQRLLKAWAYPTPALIIASVGSEIYWSSDGRLTHDDGYAEHIAQGWQRAAVRACLADLPGLESQPEIEQRRFKLSYFADDPKVADQVRARLQAANIRARVIYSHGRLLDVLPDRAGKGAAMRWAAAALSLSLDRFHAAGDSGNDLDMLEACPNAIIVANHEAALAPLRATRGAYFAKAPHAGGIVEALAHRWEGGRA